MHLRQLVRIKQPLFVAFSGQLGSADSRFFSISACCALRLKHDPKNIFGLRYRWRSKLEKPKWSLIDLVPVEKNVYEEHANVTRRSEADVEAFLNENKIKVHGEDVPKPVLSFEEANFPDYINTAIQRLSYSTPTPVQSQSWPIVLSGRDLIGVSQVGTGKSLAYILPAIVHVNRQQALSSGEGPIALLLVPTRELAFQVYQIVSYFCSESNVRCLCSYGGFSKVPFEKRFKQGAEILISTPARLINAMETGLISLHRCTYISLDEADLILDMGFEDQMKHIFTHARPDRQTLMWTATWPKEVWSLAEQFMNNPIHLKVGSSFAINENISQKVVVCRICDKDKLLESLLEKLSEDKSGKILIYSSTKKAVNFLAYKLQEEGYQALAFHRGLSQSKREMALNKFRKGDLHILVATDVASRGLVLPGIKYVINFSYPYNHQDYINRIGRAGQGANFGFTYTFFTPYDAKHASALIGVLKESNQKIPPGLRMIAKHYHRFIDSLKSKSGKEKAKAEFNLTKPRYKKTFLANSANFIEQCNNGSILLPRTTQFIENSATELDCKAPQTE